MKPKTLWISRLHCLLLAIFTMPIVVYAAGTWVPLTNQAPNTIDTMLLLSDGTVMGASGEPFGGGIGNTWYRLTPDTNGSYINGAWTALAPMNDTRLYYASQVLRDGRVLVAGGEYGSGTNSAEIYDPVANTWTYTPPPPAGQAFFGDAPSEILSNGDVLVSPDAPAVYGQTVIYSVSSNAWFVGPTLTNGNYYQAEASWLKLPDNTVLTIDPFGTNSERYIPSLKRWIPDAGVPVEIYGGTEMGGAVLLPNGQAFFLGGAGYTAIYTPSGTTNMGAWQAGPLIPNSQIAADAPCAQMANGKVLCTAAPPSSSPTSFYEYDPVANAFTEITGPVGDTFNSAAFPMRFLDLPDGTVLFSCSGTGLFVYQPDGTPLAAGKPVIKTLTNNADGSFHLTGTGFNGLSEGASYGDDAQMNSNYPLVRLTNAVGQVIYARTFNWSSTGVQTGTNVVSTDFTVPAGFANGIYSLVVVGNGFASDPVRFVYSPDVLLVFGAAFTFSGPVGGPFNTNSTAFMLTNTGVATLNWSLVNTSSWFNASPASGSLTPGGPAATVTVSLNPAATNFPFGTYTGWLLFSNKSDHVTQSRQINLQVNPPQLVVNGGFETGDFTGWTQSGSIDGYENVISDPAFIHSGQYGARISPYNLYYLTQNLPTTPGQIYLLSFWLNNSDGSGPNQFLVQWNDTTLINETNVGVLAWTQYQYLLAATSTNTTLQFGFMNVPYYFGFDDASVTAIRIPALQSPVKTGGSVNLVWSAMMGFAYQLQYTTNLTQNVWFNLGVPITASGGFVITNDISPADPKRFYRLQMLP